MQKRLFVISAITTMIGGSSAVSAQLDPESLALQSTEISALQSHVPGVKYYMEGGRVSRIYGQAFANGDSALDSAKSFMASRMNIFGGGDCTYQFTGDQDVMNGKFTAVYFQQFVNGVPVDQSNVTLLVKNTKGSPIVLAANGTQHVDPCLTKPLLTEDMAVQIIAGLNKRLEIFTEPSLAIHVGETETRLAWSFDAESPSLSQPEKFKVFVDAITGKVLEWRNLICEVDVSGSVKGYATPGQLPDQANNPATLTNLYGAKLTVTGVSTTYTDSNGNFTLPNAGTAPVTVVSTLEGRWVKVVHSTGTAMTFSQAVTPPGPLDLVYNPSPSVLTTSQVNGLIQTTAVHDFVRSISATYPGVDIQMPCNVNVTGSGNAFYNGSSINFYNAGGVYPNTCYTTVVWHEYGHHIVQSAGTAQNGYGEGMGDVTSSLLGNTNNLGMDFRGQGTGPLRNAINTVTHPSSAEIHTQGMILSGAFWLTLQQFNTALGPTAGMSLIRSLWLNSILVRPTGISPAIAIDVLTLDDNDANLNNGSPHYSLIAAGFNPKGLTVPAVPYVLMESVALPPQVVRTKDITTVYPDGISFVIRATNNLETVNPSAVRMKYALGTGAYTTAKMSPIGSNQYRCVIPTPARGQSVRYYFEAMSQQGNTTVQSFGGDNSFLSFVVGDVGPNVLADTFETNQGWSTGSSGLTTGLWVRADPIGTFNGTAAANPENDSNDVGAQCFFTGQGTVGGGVGDQDVDGGPTVLYSPTFSLARGNGIIEYSRWFYNDDGDDAMNIELSNDNGATYVALDATLNTSTSNTWIRKSFIVGNYIKPTNRMVLRIRTSDNPNNSVTEAGFDNVVIKPVR